MSSEKRAHTIEVHLFGRFRSLVQGASAMEDSVLYVPCDEGDRIQDLLQRLGIPMEEVSHLFLNHQYSAASRMVSPGDRLSVFPREMGLLYRQYFPKVE